MNNRSARFAEMAATRLADIDELVTGTWATPVTWRQPTHTVYIPAGVFEPSAPASWSASALATLESAGVDNLTRELGIEDSDVAQLTVKKLREEPIEDLRIDFEDGFTQRGVAEADKDADEDTRALAAAKVLARWLLREEESAPAFSGIRFKSFDPAFRDRGLRTLIIVLDELNRQGVLEGIYSPASDKYNPRALRLTFPKVQHHAQVEALVEILRELEQEYGLSEPIRFEVQVETPQSIVGCAGELEVTKIINAAEGRCLSLHYGTYDYSASMGVDAALQSMEHPVADHAKDMMQVATAAVGVELSDGSINRVPAGSEEQILAGWKLHYRLVTRHLERGVRQGWDLHPNQLITRHLATIAYFRKDWAETAERLGAYLAGDTSRWIDEPATAKAMAGYLRRAHACGAITDEELATANVSSEELAQLQATGRVSTSR